MYQIMAHKENELRVLNTVDHKEVACAIAEQFRQTEKGYVIWVIKMAEEQVGRGK